ncbi:MAG: hypothetical protein ABSB84_14380 [Verrucomicrobiota bacterium]
MAIGSRLGGGVAIELNAADFVSGPFCQAEKRSAATAYIQNPPQAPPAGKFQGPREFGAIRCVILCVLNLAIEGFISA